MVYRPLDNEEAWTDFFYFCFFDLSDHLVFVRTEIFCTYQNERMGQCRHAEMIETKTMKTGAGKTGMELDGNTKGGDE